MPIDPSTVRHFNTLSRDNLRDMARANNVRGRRYGVSIPFSSATKDELIAGFDHERNNNGRFAYQSTTSAAVADGNLAASNGNLTVKAQNVILFLQGKGCNESGTYYVGAEAFKDGRVRLANCENEGPNDVDDLDDYDNFWTTLDDLSDLVTALTQYGNE
jgi:hypothetical protein